MRQVRLVLLAAAAALAGCAQRQPVSQYAAGTPAFHLEQFYAGHSRGYGLLFNSAGGVIKRFTADENGSWDGSTLRLHEHYLYDDGKTQDRDWIYARNGQGEWIGRTPEVVGVTTGQEAGNAYRMHYTFDLTRSGSDHTLDFDDWSWMVAPKVMLNRAWGSKFGIGFVQIQAVFIHD